MLALLHTAGLSGPAKDLLAGSAHAFVAGLVATALLLCVAMVVERRMTPARAPSFGHTRLNLCYTVAALAIVSALRPLTLVAPLLLTRALGAGLIVFPPGVPGWIGAFVSVLLFTDLLEYLWHRAQHTWPLWSMHELHHSAPHYDVTLTYRHFWLEPVLKVSFLYPWIGILFRVPPSVATAVAMIFMVNHHVAHLNVRVQLGRFALLVANPQYHRLHHARDEAHYNKNFCDLLPLWDILFGTLERLKKDEFVDVGLDSGHAPGTLVEALMWPWRQRAGSAGTVSERASGQ